MATPASSDEGEIVENVGSGVGDSKATALPQIDGTGVDRPDRNRARYSRSRSPEYEDSSSYTRRSRSPRGYKRSRHDRDYNHSGRLNSDPRRFRVHYEDTRDDYYRSRLSYDDDDRPPSRSSMSGLRYDDRDYPRDREESRNLNRDRDDYPAKRPRNRSRSPFWSSRGDRVRGDRFHRNEERRRRSIDRDQEESARRGGPGSPKRPRDAAAFPRSTSVEIDSTSQVNSASTTGLSSGGIPVKRPTETSIPQSEEAALETEPLDVEAEIERRRRRREELLAKSRGATPLLVQAVQASEKTLRPTAAHTQTSTPLATEVSTPRSVLSSPSSPNSGMQDGMSPAALDISNDHELINTHGKSQTTEEDGPSAADYDPTVDMREDEKRDELRHGHVGPHGEILASDQKTELAPKEGASPKKSAEEDDDLDMFAEDFDEAKFVAPKATPQLQVARDVEQAPATLAPANEGGILEGDDKDGYYKIRIGEIFNGRYQIQAMLGKGMFSGVARAVDITTKKLVAIKMMRNNDALRKGGFVEISILQKLNDADPENKKHIIKFERHFEHKGHLCLAFENLSLNLREVLKKFGNNVGINLNATRVFAHQMFVALAHMRKCTIIHADLKPDNILVNETRTVLKICDLGTAIDRSDAATAHTEITPYLVSRFYRAPEIILGMQYDYAVDMWSIGCTLYELYSGKILFAGDSNNQMLKAIMEIRGRFSPKLYKRGQLWHMHFDDMGNFISVEHDKALGKTNVRTLAVVKPTRDIRTRLMATSGGMNDVESRDLNHFIDLLERCLTLNPDKRITPSEALKHPFFTSRLGASR